MIARGQISRGKLRLCVDICKGDDLPAHVSVTFTFGGKNKINKIAGSQTVSVDAREGVSQKAVNESSSPLRPDPTRPEPT